MTSKADLRRQLLSQFQGTLPWEASALIPWLQEQTGVWGIYQPLKGELDPAKVIRESSHLQWVYPRVLTNSVGAGLTFHSLDGKSLVKGSLAWEPPANAPVKKPEEISGLLIPGLAFDETGIRLGRGKGYYDRFLASFQGIKVGVIPQARIFPELPRESWDVRMNYLATEDQFRVCQ